MTAYGAEPARDSGKRVLVAGIYLVDHDNTAAAILAELGRSREWTVDQRWIALGGSRVPRELEGVTIARHDRPAPKFTLLNDLLASAPVADYDFVVVSDDDIDLPEGFLDRFLALAGRCDFALAQPARSHDSFIDHPFVEQLDGLDARCTRFVEIGPLFAMRRDAVPLLVPFDEASPMGWGYDVVWPVVLDAAGLRLGIVDATPVVHKLRRTASRYDQTKTRAVMKAYLARRPHLTRDEAFFVIDSHAQAAH